MRTSKKLYLTEMDDAQEFGCEDCWPAAAEAAWLARSELTPLAELVDESHFHVMILACSRCAQRFLSIFTEMIDWAEGDDAQDWQLLPITEPEAANLSKQGASIETKLEALGTGRRSLHRDYPSAAAPRVFWSDG